MKILLTGSNGMVGKNILEHAGAKAYQFLTPSHAELNLLDQKEVEAYFKAQKPQAVIHCAGLVGGIQANMREPVRYLIENLEMGKNVLLSARASGVTKLVNLSSSCIYHKNSDGFLKEEEILTGPLEPTNEGYALAKITVMRLAQYMNKEFGKNHYKTIIPCNLYGRWDKFDEATSHMLPAVIRKIDKAVKGNESSVEIWGSGKARREFMYAADLADFIFFALDNWDKVPETLNVGLGNDHTIKEYYDVVAEVLGYTGDFHHDLSKPEGMRRKVVSVNKANALGWLASTSLREGIQATYKFYLEKGNV
ncbi:MAG TPA: GDP-L-fucose synthase [Bacteriovoracaceae bacterium]|nr:GDP-L-fucose synthase [Bacteriovoracaceae bacterium]